MREPTSRLERRARARLASGDDPQEVEQLEAPELRRAVHELHVHQIELELQNEELQKTQRRLEESRAALSASEHRYRELFERAPVGYLRLDRNGAILEANETVADLLGVGKSQLAGRKLCDFIAPQGQDVCYLHRHAALRGEHPGPAQVELRGFDGAMRDVEIGAAPSEGGHDEIRVAILDVTARERAEAERHESERQRRLITEALPLAVSFVGADGRYEFCNGAFRALCGASAGAIEGRPIYEVFDEEIYAAWRDQVREALGGRIARFEGELCFPETGLRHVSALFAPDQTSEGRVRGFYTLIDDRTDLEEARRGLREVAAQATLAEERERRALAIDLHDEAGQLLSLASINLRALQEEVAETASAGPVREIADLIRESREAIASLTFELSPPLLYDVGFVEAAEWLAESLRDRYGLKTEIEKAGDVPDLDEAASVTLFRALRELLINVAKHSGTNRSAVTIRGGADGTTVAVRDDGAGFDPAGPRSGFGLRSIFDRIESLGGRVVIESAPDQGAKISMIVPAGEDASS